MNLIRWMLSKENKNDPFTVRWGRWCLRGLVWATVHNSKPTKAEAISRGNAQGCPRSVRKVNSLGTVAKSKWNKTRGVNQFSKLRGRTQEQMISWKSWSSEGMQLEGDSQIRISDTAITTAPEHGSGWERQKLTFILNWCLHAMVLIYFKVLIQGLGRSCLMHT